MIVAIVLFIIILLISAGDCYSTAKLLRYNHKMTYDKKFRRKVLTKIRNQLKKDESKAEISAVGRKMIRKFGGDRAMLYMFIFGYQPLALIILWMLLIDPQHILFAVLLIGVLFGVLWRQILKALTINKQFGVKI